MQEQFMSFTEIVHIPWEKPFLSVHQSYFADDAFKNVKIDLLQAAILFLNVERSEP